MTVKSVRRASVVNSMRISVFLLATVLLTDTPTGALADEQTDLKKVEDQIQADRKRAKTLENKRRKASEDMHNLRREAIAAAKKAQQHEARLIDLEATLLELSQREDAIRESLTRRRSQMTGTLAALQRLSADDREVLLVRDLEGFTNEEAAGTLEVSVAALKSRLHRARLRLAAAVRGNRGGR